MRTLWKASLGAIVLSLVLVTVVLASQTGVSGRLWDSGTPSQPWAHGAQVAAVECTATGTLPASPDFYGCDNANTVGNVGEFDFAWGTDSCADVTVGSATPVSGDYVCLYIIWAPGGSGQPATTLTEPQQVLLAVGGRMSFDGIQSATGPNAITLANVTAQSANFWLPIGLAAISVVAVGALVIARRRRA